MLAAEPVGCRLRGERHRLRRAHATDHGALHDVPGAARIHLDLAAPAQRARWQAAFAGQLDATLAELRARGVRAVPLSCAAPSDAWLTAAGAGAG